MSQIPVPAEVYLSIGANQGDRLAALRFAVAALQCVPQIQLLTIAPLFQTKPVGFVDQPDFYNSAIRLQTSLSPFQLLDVCQAIERQAGRKRDDQRWGPRTLDIDLLTYNQLRLDGPELILPHPRMHERAFVQIPLSWITPGTRRLKARGVRLVNRGWLCDSARAFLA